ncbi:MAG: hypothetical protein ACQKBW_07085, partial [Puniceicoccales bacterium]
CCQLATSPFALSLMCMIAKARHHFTPRAQAVWDEIPTEGQEAILDNVWCGDCRDATRIEDYTGTWDDGEIRLQGFCSVCGHVCVRIVERAE